MEEASHQSPTYCELVFNGDGFVAGDGSVFGGECWGESLSTANTYSMLPKRELTVSNMICFLIAENEEKGIALAVPCEFRN